MQHERNHNMAHYICFRVASGNITGKTHEKLYKVNSTPKQTPTHINLTCRSSRLCLCNKKMPREIVTDQCNAVIIYDH